MRRLTAVLIVLVVAASCRAELRLAALFSDGMVLQRNRRIPVWGWTQPGSAVSVAFAGQSKTEKAGGDGKFMVWLEKMEASAQPQTLTVSVDEESVAVGNVLVGEVWLCSGQSNMGWSVSKSMNHSEEMAAANYPHLRMFMIQQRSSLTRQTDCTGGWQVCTPQNVGSFSATAYFFGREIHKELQVPVGLIKSAWGGTRIEAWMPMAALEDFPSVMEFKAQEDARAADFDEALEEKRYARQFALWIENEKLDPADRKKMKRPKKQGHPHTAKTYPAGLYNAMIRPLVPYGLRGVVWYQGEANAKNIDDAVRYRELLETMLVCWRKDWGVTLPFYAVQLPNYDPRPEKRSGESPWIYIRESILHVSQEVPRVGIAVGIDVGEAKKVHPKNKQAIGYRLAQQALAKTYKQKIVADSPLYKSMKKEGDRIIIHFEDTGSDLVARGGVPLKTFTIAGADRRFVDAQADIEGKTVVVCAPEIDDPVAVRYAWAGNPIGCNLYNRADLPASPFRTDDWPPVEE